MPRVPTVRPNGRKIRELRVGKGLSTTQVARLCGPNRHPQSIRNLELQDWPASVLFINQVARVLGVKPDELILGDPDDENGAAA